jgi:hypothetical protein
MLSDPEKTGVSSQTMSASERQIAWVGRAVNLVMFPFTLFFGIVMMIGSVGSGSRVTAVLSLIVFSHSSRA